MNVYKKLAGYSALLIAVSLLVTGCQKFDKPELGDYTKDNNPPGGPLKFYLAFDGTGTNAAMNAVDSIKATFPIDNPLTLVDGVNGKAIKGESKKFIKFAKPNEWAITSKSFTVSFWIKRDGQTKNNTGTNGPEFPLAFKSSNGHWSGGNFFILLEGNNAACAIKAFAVDKNMGENWMTWEGGNTVAGLLDNAWHHLVFVYDAASSKLTFYKDGAANGVVPGWGTHGDVNIDNAAITEVRIGGGPGTSYDTDDWLSSTWKGNLDQFRMYSKALSAAEVSALFAAKL